MLRLYKLLALYCISFGVLAQNHHEKCGTQIILNQLLENEPGLRTHIENSEMALRKTMENSNSKSQTSFIIPVVVHIVHEYGPEYISDAQVYNTIAQMNIDFQKMNADTSSVVSSFQGIIGNPDIEFRLASKDPLGNCTNGINRVYSPEFTNHGGCPNGNCGSPFPDAWPQNRYLNIWVVNSLGLGGGTLAYSWLASSNRPTGVDGVVCRYQFFGGPSRTMTHEVGHYLNLYHTWGTTNNSGLASNCNQDDFVGDTPNCTGTFSCNLGRNSCNSLDNVQNYMDYAGCPSMFTNGQVNRMHAAINTGLSQRDFLVSGFNLISTGTDDISYANLSPCSPIPEFTVNNTDLCQGDSVQFTDWSYNATFDSTWVYHWTFPGGNPYTSNERNPVVTYDTSGIHDVSLSITNIAGSSDTITRTGLIEVAQGPGSFIAPYVEFISSSDWPQNIDPSLEWTINNPQGSFIEFEWSNNAYFSPPSCIYLNNYAFNSIGEHELISPAMDLTGLSPGSAFLNFQVAHKRRNNESETMDIYYSTDCGITWNLIYNVTANELLSQFGLEPDPYVPLDTNAWKFLSYDISLLAGHPNVRFAFRLQSSQGNNFYFDDIAVSDLPEPAVYTSLVNKFGNEINVYPNPNEGSFYLEIPEEERISKIEVFNNLGKKVNFKSIQHTQSKFELLPIDEKPETGLYFYRINFGDTYKLGKFLIK